MMECTLYSAEIHISKRNIFSIQPQMGLDGKYEIRREKEPANHFRARGAATARQTTRSVDVESRTQLRRRRKLRKPRPYTSASCTRQRTLAWRSMSKRSPTSRWTTASTARSSSAWVSKARTQRWKLLSTSLKLPGIRWTRSLRRTLFSAIWLLKMRAQPC